MFNKKILKTLAVVNLVSCITLGSGVMAIKKPEIIKSFKYQLSKAKKSIDDIKEKVSILSKLPFGTFEPSLFTKSIYNSLFKKNENNKTLVIDEKKVDELIEPIQSLDAPLSDEDKNIISQFFNESDDDLTKEQKQNLKDLKFFICLVKMVKKSLNGPIVISILNGPKPKECKKNLKPIIELIDLYCENVKEDFSKERRYLDYATTDIDLMRVLLCMCYRLEILRLYQYKGKIPSYILNSQMLYTAQFDSIVSDAILSIDKEMRQGIFSEIWPEVIIEDQELTVATSSKLNINLSSKGKRADIYFGSVLEDSSALNSKQKKRYITKCIEQSLELLCKYKGYYDPPLEHHERLPEEPFSETKQHINVQRLILRLKLLTRTELKLEAWKNRLKDHLGDILYSLSKKQNALAGLLADLLLVNAVYKEDPNNYFKEAVLLLNSEKIKSTDLDNLMGKISDKKTKLLDYYFGYYYLGNRPNIPKYAHWNYVYEIHPKMVERLVRLRQCGQWSGLDTEEILEKLIFTKQVVDRRFGKSEFLEEFINDLKYKVVGRGFESDAIDKLAVKVCLKTLNNEGNAVDKKILNVIDYNVTNMGAEVRNLKEGFKKLNSIVFNARVLLNADEKNSFKDINKLYDNNINETKKLIKDKLNNLLARLNELNIQSLDQEFDIYNELEELIDACDGPISNIRDHLFNISLPSLDFKYLRDSKEKLFEGNTMANVKSLVNKNIKALNDINYWGSNNLDLYNQAKSNLLKFSKNLDNIKPETPLYIETEVGGELVEGLSPEYQNYDEYINISEKYYEEAQAVIKNRRKRIRELSRITKYKDDESLLKRLENENFETRKDVLEYILRDLLVMLEKHIDYEIQKIYYDGIFVLPKGIREVYYNEICVLSKEIQKIYYLDLKMDQNNKDKIYNYKELSPKLKNLLRKH